MALNRGFSAPIVMQLGGWKSEAMMRRYGGRDPQARRGITSTTLYPLKSGAQRGQVGETAEVA
jgi:hypothetical protein